MAVRALGVVAVLAVAGVAAGYGVSSQRTDEPATISVAAPVPGVSPSYPVNEYDVHPDPGVAPLPTGLELGPRVLREGGYKIEAAVPKGWMLAELDGAGWNFSVADNPPNSYVLRVEILAGNRASVAASRATRVLRLESTEADGNLDNLVVEDTTDDGFVATYLQNGYRRVTIERFLALGGTTAYATVAVTGREVDRDGMNDLIERVSTSLRLP